MNIRKIYIFLKYLNLIKYVTPHHNQLLKTSVPPRIYGFFPWGWPWLAGTCRDNINQHFIELCVLLCTVLSFCSKQCIRYTVQLTTEKACTFYFNGAQPNESEKYLNNKRSTKATIFSEAHYMLRFLYPSSEVYRLEILGTCNW